MRRLSIVLLGIVWLSRLAAGDPAPLSLAEYKSELERYGATIQKIVEHPEQAVTLNRDVSPLLQVRTNEGTITVALEFLRNELNRFLVSAPNLRPTILTQLSSRIEAMRAEADRFEEARTRDQAIHDSLNHILSAGEFSGVHGPTQLELLEERIKDWINEKLNKLFPSATDLDQLGQIFVWIVIAIASAILAVFLYRQSRERLLDRPREILPFAPPSRSWRGWLTEAHKRALLGEWREAIRLGFWAAVSRMESDGVWSPDKTRTPREYLKAIPVVSATRQPFASATTIFESAWYGGRSASSEDFESFIAEIEKLGCRE